MKSAEKEMLHNGNRAERVVRIRKRINSSTIFESLEYVNKTMIIDSYITLWYLWLG
jgi:hypothetical protein